MVLLCHRRRVDLLELPAGGTALAVQPDGEDTEKDPQNATNRQDEGGNEPRLSSDTLLQGARLGTWRG